MRFDIEHHISYSAHSMKQEFNLQVLDSFHFQLCEITPELG